MWTVQHPVSKTCHQTIHGVHTSKESATSGAQGAKAQTWQKPWCNTKVERQICRSFFLKEVWTSRNTVEHPGIAVEIRRSSWGEQAHTYQSPYLHSLHPCCQLQDPPAQPCAHPGKVNPGLLPDSRWHCGCVFIVFQKKNLRQFELACKMLQHCTQGQYRPQLPLLAHPRAPSQAFIYMQVGLHVYVEVSHRSLIYSATICKILPIHRMGNS